MSSGWHMSRRLWSIADACAHDISPFASEVARGSDPGSLEALARLPTELLNEERYPALSRLRERLRALCPAVLRWEDLYKPWREGGGGTDPLRMAGLLEALGFGLEPDPRTGRRDDRVVVLFPGALSCPRSPDRDARPVFAVAAPVLAASRLSWPPLWLWVRLVAVSDLSADAAPRMEAHLAYRAATGMRPGPIRRSLQAMPVARRAALGKALADLELRHPADEAFHALDRALRLLGPPAGDLHQRGVSTGDRTEDEAGSPGSGDSGSRRLGTATTYPREAFDDWVAAGAVEQDVPVGALGTTRPLASVLRSLAHCMEPLETGTHERLGLREGATYADAVREVQARLAEGREGQTLAADSEVTGDTHQFLRIPRPEEDIYDPSDPLVNLGWPVLYRGRLFRVDDEVLLGLEGQPDLPWEALDPSEVRPAPPDVLSAELAKS